MSGRLLQVVRGVVVCGLVMAGAACSDGPTAPTAIEESFTLAPGGVQRIGDGAVVVRFDGVSGDSRCPADALCILGGDAIVHVQVQTSVGTLDYELHTGNMLPVRHGDVTVGLVELQPYPFSARPIEPHEYRATLRVSR